MPAADPPWEALEALAAGELPPEEARALRERLAIEPGWERAWRRVESVEALLRGEPLLALPLSLVQDTLAGIAALEPVRPWHVAGRAAAAILVFGASWFAFAGQAPALAHAGPIDEVAVRVPALAPPALPETVVRAGEGPALLLAAGGLALLALGLALAVRWHRRPEGRVA